jgi:hypothetical protein
MAGRCRPLVDHWLKDIDTGIMTEPPVTVYVRHWHALTRT